MVLELKPDNSVDVVCLVESFCNADGVWISELSAKGFNVVNCLRTRLPGSLITNHDGFVVFASD
jgi:hypothetical protein